MAKRIIVDEDRCLSCKACVIECALAHTSIGTMAKALEAGAARLQPRMHVEPAGEFGMPVQCRHCADAPCVAVCPKDALQRRSEDGPVLLDESLCIGCGFCVLACPFGAIDLSVAGKGVVKCDLCVERTDAGKLPACVSACPTAALKYDEMEQPLESPLREAGSDASTGAEENEQRPDDGDTVCCVACGQAVGTRKKVAFVRKKLAGYVKVADLCPRCRRIRFARSRARSLGAPATAGRTHRE
jgi:Fe-S-cluster-containing dehydrogenase component